MQSLVEIPRTAQVEMLEDAYAIHGELLTAFASLNQLRRSVNQEEDDPAQARVKQALLLQAVVLLSRAVTAEGKQRDKGRKYPLSASIYEDKENGVEAWTAFQKLRDKVLVHDEAPAFQVRVGATKIEGDVAVGHLSMSAAFEADPQWIEMIRELVGIAGKAVDARIADLHDRISADLKDWDPGDAKPIRVTVPSLEDFGTSRRTWNPPVPQETDQ